ncbi:MAG TPA: hypothetical protein VMM57_02650 [Bacteroidota bacterium]|nr:hypothetical protein [Bacteroidota bacterium]
MQPPLLAYIAASSYIPVALIGVVRFRRLEAGMKMIAVLFVFEVTTTGLGRYLGTLLLNNHPLSQFDALFEFVVLILFFVRALPDRASTVLRVTLTVYVTYWILAKLFLESMTSFETYTIPVGNCILLLISIYVLDVLARGDLPLIRSGSAMVALGTAVFSGAGILTHPAGQVALGLPIKFFALVWNINWSLHIVSNFFFGWALAWHPDR